MCPQSFYGSWKTACRISKIDEMLLRRLPLGERDGLPFTDELMRGHAEASARVGGKIQGDRSSH